jgi:predicted esterase
LTVIGASSYKAGHAARHNYSPIERPHGIGCRRASDQVIARTIAASTHGRYLVEPPASVGPAPLLVGCHGYAEGAEDELERLRAMAPAGDWLRVSVQALHPFYRSRSQQVVAGWMTSQDRELAIADNIAYVNAVVEAVAREWTVTPTLVFSGFSQGVSMAFRAAAGSRRAVSGVIVSGGDVPPELSAADLARVPAVLIGRGVGDEWYAAAKRDADVTRLREAGVSVTALEFDGGHEWAQPLIEAGRAFLEKRAGSPFQR